MKQNCEICKIIQSEHGNVTVADTSYWSVVLNPNQAYLGTAWVALRTHEGSISELTEAQWAQLHVVMKHYESAVRRAFGAKLFNWSCLMNNAFKVDRPAPHVHWHVRPRYDTAVKIAGEAFDDPNFAHHYQLKIERAVDSDVAKEIAKKIRENW